VAWAHQPTVKFEPARNRVDCGLEAGYSAPTAHDRYLVGVEALHRSSCCVTRMTAAPSDEAKFFTVVSSCSRFASVSTAVVRPE